MFLRLPRWCVPLLRVAVGWRWLLMAARLVVRLPRRPTMRTGRPSGSPSVWLMSLPSNGRHLLLYPRGLRFRHKRNCTTHFAFSCLVLQDSGPDPAPSISPSSKRNSSRCKHVCIQIYILIRSRGTGARRALPLSRLSISQTEKRINTAVGPDRTSSSIIGVSGDGSAPKRSDRPRGFSASQLRVRLSRAPPCGHHATTLLLPRAKMRFASARCHRHCHPSIHLAAFNHPSPPSVHL